jgi:hypothetical protein
MSLPEEDLPPAWLRNEVAIDVQVDGLKSFSKALLEDLEKNFGTHVPQVYDVMSQHACVGDGMFFAEMDAVRTRHYEALNGIVQQLQAFTMGTYALGHGADVVATNYGHADNMARVTAQDVDKVMAPASGAPTAAAPTAGGGPSTATPSADSNGIVDRGTE